MVPYMEVDEITCVMFGSSIIDLFHVESGFVAFELRISTYVYVCLSAISPPGDVSDGMTGKITKVFASPPVALQGGVFQPAHSGSCG